MLVVAVLVGGVPAQKQSAQMQRDIEFVRQLATKLGFISLAQSEVDQMKLRYKDSPDARQIDMLGVEISLIGAKIMSNQEEKRALYTEAIQRCEQILEATDNGPTALAARTTLANAALEFGRFLADEIELARTEDPGKVEDLEKQAGEVFRKGEDAAEAAMNELKVKGEKDPDAELQYHLMWMNRGILLREHARAIKKDREALADYSRSALEDLVFEVGEETALGQRALFEYAMNDEVVGNYDSAVRSYKDVIDAAETALTSEDVVLPSDVRELMVTTIEEAYQRIAETRLDQDRIDDVIKTMQEYRDRLKALDVPLINLDDPKPDQGNEDPRFGHGVYLAAARAMAETGDSDQVARGLKLAQFISDQHPGDFVGMRARIVLKDIVDMKATHVSGSLLLDAAEGDYQAKNYESAIKGYKRALAAMTPQEQQQLALKAIHQMAYALAVEGRELPATLALKYGLETYGANSPDEWKEKAATLIQRTMSNVRLRSHNGFPDLDQQVADLAAKYGSVADAAKRYWNEGLSLMGDDSEKDHYDKAVAAFQRVEQGSPYYELAQARIVSSLQRKGDFEGARKVIADYRQWLNTKDGKLPSDRADLQQSREIAQGEIAFAEAYMLYLEGVGRDDSAKKDPTKFPQVVKLLSDFPSEHGKQQPNLVPVVRYLLGRSYTEMGKLDKAEAEYRTLQKESPHNDNIALLATALFSAYYDQIKAKQNELDALKKQNDPRAADAEKELRDLQQRTVALGDQYFDTSDAPQYSILYLTLEQQKDLAKNAPNDDAAKEAWKKVQTLGSRIVETFKDAKGDVSEKVDKFVRPIVGEALLHQTLYGQAYDMLVAAEKASPSNYQIKRMICLALGGWKEIGRFGNIVPYQGMGKPAEAYDKYWGEYKTYGLNPTIAPRFSLPWYQFYWECYNFAYEAAKSDSKYQAYAKTLYNTAQSIDNFKALRDLGPEGENLYQLFSTYPPR